MAFLAQALAVAAKDVRAELRTRDAVSGSLVFALLVLVIFNFAFDLEGEMSEVAGPGVLWVAIALAGMMGLGHVFAREREQGGLQGLLLTPMDRSAIFLGKVSGALLFTFALELFLLPLDGRFRPFQVGDVLNHRAHTENLTIAGKSITLASQFYTTANESLIEQTIIDGMFAAYAAGRELEVADVLKAATERTISCIRSRSPT